MGEELQKNLSHSLIFKYFFLIFFLLSHSYLFVGSVASNNTNNKNWSGIKKRDSSNENETKKKE